MARTGVGAIPVILLSFVVTGGAQVVSITDTTLAHQYFAKAEQLAAGAKYDSSSFYYEKAITLYEKNGKSLQVAQTYHNLGNLFMGKNDTEQALSYFNRALVIRLQSLGAEHLEVAKSYNNIGVAYQLKGDDEKALASHEKSLMIKLNALGEKSAEAANSYNNMGNVLRNVGDLEAALAYINKALIIRQQLFGENHPRVAHTYINLGNIYILKSDYDQGIACYKKSLNFFLAAGGKAEDLGPIYNNLGHAYRQKNDHDTALENLNQALATWKKVLDESHPDLGRIYFNLGRTYVLKNDYDQALAYYENCLALWKPVYGEKHPDMGDLYAVFAQLYWRKNELANTLAYYQKSLVALSADFNNENIYRNPSLQAISNKSTLQEVLKYKAETLEALFSAQTSDLRDLRMSLSTYQLAADLVDQMRNDHKEEGSQLTLAERTAALYEGAIHAALRAYDITKQMPDKFNAFYFAEKSKATILAQALQESSAKQFAGIPAALLEKEKSLRLDQAFYETEIQKEKFKTQKSDSAKVREFESRLFARKREYGSLMRQLEKAYPRYYDLKYRTETASVADLQKSLDQKTALLEYFLGDSTINIFAITREAYHTVTVKSDSALQGKMIALGNSFKNVSSQTEYLQNASELYRILVQPIAFQISSKPKWIIIPGGELHHVPFEALLKEPVLPSGRSAYHELPYLIKDHEISYHYSATLWLKNRTEKAAGGYIDTIAGFAPVFSKAANNGTLWFGPPANPLGHTVASPDKTKYLKTRDGKTLEELEHSAQETQNIVALFPARSRIYLHAEASEDNFKKHAGGYKYVHIATHGVVVNDSPKLSNLAFSQSQDQNAPEDGFLYSGETYNLKLTADLLTLSSCESGTGQLAKGEGLMALTRGFFYSGARNIVASLWKVYDEHTSRLMVEFYREIASGKSYSAALREAKLKMIVNPETAAPQSWAGFVLIGR